MRYPIGENCPTDKFVVTLEKCKAASAVLGLNYGGDNVEPTLPAGCYWKGGYSYFKAADDASRRVTRSFGDTGGVCLFGKCWHCNTNKNVYTKYEAV